MKEKRLLCIIHHRQDRSPGQRFRIEQFLPALKADGWKVEWSNILNETDDKIFYSSGHYSGKFRVMLKSFRHRLKDLKRAKNFDAVFVYREAFMLGTSWFEKRLSKKNIPMVFDFDDSIWLNDTSAGNQNLAWLKSPQKTAKICRYASVVTVGNQYLADYAKKYNTNVKIFPTVVDTEYHKPGNRKRYSPNKICIGWTGTQPTLKHFETVLPVLEKLNKRYPDSLSFKVIVNFPYQQKEIPLEVLQWNKASEIDDLSNIDIGIMPLPDDEWSRGKCGFKGIQYMAMEIPAVMSPVGMNTQIISDGENGFLAKTPDEWLNKLSLLIESEELRKKTGKAGRNTIIQRYSREAHEIAFTEFMNDLI